MPAVRQPVIFVPHGGGPCFWIEFPPPFGPHAWDNLRDYLAGVLKSLPERPKAFLVVTAHWETDQPTVSVNPKPGMLYDYNGFPPHTYKLSYPAPGDPELAAEVKRLIEAAGLPVATDGERGFDHGVFVPFLIVDPKAEIPVVMLSLRKDLDPAFHIKLGKALAPLRDQGVAIVGSGMSFHDLRHFRDGDTTASAAFDAWLDETAKAPGPEREARLTAVGQGAVGARVPSARGAPLAADGGGWRRRRQQGNARLQRQDRRQDDLGVSVRMRLSFDTARRNLERAGDGAGASLLALRHAIERRAVMPAIGLSHGSGSPRSSDPAIASAHERRRSPPAIVAATSPKTQISGK